MIQSRKNEPIIYFDVFQFMKKLLSVLITFFCFETSFAQDSVQVVERSWAGGVCCSSGSDFTLDIPLSTEQRNIDSIWLFVPGYSIHLSENSLRTSNKNCTALFGWSSHDYSQDLPKINFYGITEEDVVYEDNYTDTPTITLFLSNGKTKIVPVKFREEIIAYP